MAFQSLYRRYRPQRFAELKGQDHVVAALRNAAAADRLGHAYLFSGPRGTGKTSTARILAKVLNCAAPEGGEPCGVCDACRAIESGSSFDVTELDAASNTGVDAMRDLIASTALASPGRTRLYILDEVHMLSKGAAAALLKTLEEPPDHVVFVLATTDPDKVLPTIRSRTQHLEFRLLPAAELEAHLRWVIDDAGLEVDDEGVAEAVREGAGSARDALSALDRIVAAGSGARRPTAVGPLLEAVSEKDVAAGLVEVAAGIDAGLDPRLVGEQLLASLRNIFLVAMRADLSGLPEADRAEAQGYAERLRPAEITRALEVLGEALVEMRQAPDPRIPLEVAVVRIARPQSDPSPAALLARIEALEQAVRSDGGPSAPVPEGPGAAGAGADTTAASPAGGSGGSPADEARRALAGARSRQSGGAPGEPAAEAVTEAPSPTPTAQAAPPAAEAATAAANPLAEPSPPPAADLPSRDELTLAWGDRVLDGLRPKLKALFASGRFLDATGPAVAFALPNAAHVTRCEPHRADVEQALAADFGRAVPLALVVDPGPDAAAPAPSGAATTPGEAEDLGAAIDDLEDAGDAQSGLQRVKEVFGAVEVIEEPEGET